MFPSYRAKTEGGEGSEGKSLALKTPGSTEVGDWVIFDLFVTTLNAVTIPGLTVVQVKEEAEAFSYVIAYGEAAGAGEHEYEAEWGGATQYRLGSITVFGEAVGVNAIAHEIRPESDKIVGFPAITTTVAECLDVAFAFAADGVATMESGWTTRINGAAQFMTTNSILEAGVGNEAFGELNTVGLVAVFRFAIAGVPEVEPEPDTGAVTYLRVEGGWVESQTRMLVGA